MPPPTGITSNQFEFPLKNAKDLVYSFLAKHFEYNPDAHVRSAIDEFKISDRKNDITRIPVELVGNYKIANEALIPALKRLTVDQPTYNVALKVCDDPEILESLILLKNNEELQDAIKCNIEKSNLPNIPIDTFYQYQMYTETQYDELVEATNTLYADKPDLDFACMAIEVFEGTDKETKDDFDKLVQKYKVI